jgi:hypothetical protein
MSWIFSAKVGDKVVCTRGAAVGRPETGFWCPQTGEVYTIRQMWMYGDNPILLLMEYVHPESWDGVNEMGWDATRFRPVTPRNTDISFAYEILRKATKPVEEVVV